MDISKQIKEIILNSCKKIADNKNIFLPFAGIIYILGFINWSLVSYYFGFGPITVLKTQYFVSGFVSFFYIIDTCILNVLYFNPEGDHETIRKCRVFGAEAPARHIVSS